MGLRGASPTSVFRHLGGALWFAHDPDKAWFMVYTANYDASSKDEVVDVPLVVAGIAASETKWIQFEQDWKDVLTRYDVEFLDMAKCAQWKGHPYKTWNRDENLRRPFLAGLAEALINCATQVAVVRIIPADYNAVNDRYRLGSEFWQSAYPIAAVRCMGLMENILAERGEPFEIEHIVEYGDSGQGALAALKAEGAAVTVRRKKGARTGAWFHPFGACDMVAYEYRKAIQQKLETGSHIIKMRVLLKELRKIPTKVVYISQADLVAMCEAEPDKYPRRDQ